MRASLLVPALGFLSLGASGVAVAGPLDGWSSDNVEYVQSISLPGTEGGHARGRYFYARNTTGIHVFDVSDPARPVEVSHVVIPGLLSGVEDPDTNGRILPASDSRPHGYSDVGGTLHVVDVSDKSSATVISQLDDAGDHTLTCVLDCTWVYGGQIGRIIDLRDPENPRLHPTRWTDSLPLLPGPGTSGQPHDVTEVAPGLVLTASTPMFLLDARRNPVRPRVLARSDGSFYSRGGVEWPNRGTDDFILSYSTSLLGRSPSCVTRNAYRGTSLESGFKTWDATHWKETGLFTGIDEYFLSDGHYNDGNPPASAAGCFSQWFDVHPAFHDGGIVAAASGGNGVKFLEVDGRGRISEVGFWLPVKAGDTQAAYWIDHEYVYTTNFDRGIDILRFDPE